MIWIVSLFRFYGVGHLEKPFVAMTNEPTATQM